MQLFLIATLVAIQCSAQASEQQYVGEAFENRVRELSPAFTSAPITRNEILRRARLALNYRFQMSRENHDSRSLKNSCETPGNWLRPYRLYNRIGSSIRAIPYKWGGYFPDITEFENNLRAGKLVGDVCTCSDEKRNWCVVPETIGLDCSGFVSFAWGTDYHITSTMHKISEKIAWEELLPGDAINKPGHIILFTGFTEDREYIHGIESSTRCEGVCEVHLRIYDLKREGFSPIRYTGLVQ